MANLTGRLFIRSDKEEKYRRWENLTEAEKKNISECLNREAAYAGGFRREITTT